MAIIKPGVLPPCTAAQQKAQAGCDLVMDEQGRTAIELTRNKDDVRFIPMASEGCYVTYTSPSVFRTRFPNSLKDAASLAKHPSMKHSTIERAARCYVSHALYAGASEEALKALEELVPITPKEKETIMAVKKPDPKLEKPKKSTDKAAQKHAEANAKPAVAKVKRVSAGATFRELIMQGKLTDDQIFAEVQKRHPDVGDDKRKYVAWYRNDLLKKGENPPASKKNLKA